MAKKKQFVTAAAAFAVAASAVAPAITADAASTTVRLSSDYVRGGDLNAALDKEYKGSEIHWYKSSIDMNKLGVFQTAKGFVKGKGIKVEKKLRVLNYAQEIKPESEFVFEQGVPVSGIRIQPVLFADGVVYNKPLSVAGFSTEKVGEFEGTLTYANKAYGVVTKTVKYKVVASKVEFSEVKHEVEGDMLSVSADVKNLKEGEKVELVIYPGKDESKALDPIAAEVKDGKVSVSAKDVPAGTHSFVLQSGDVKTAAMEFKVEEQKPMVSGVEVLNAKQVEVKFNKAIEASTVLNSNDEVRNIAFTTVGTAVNAGTLSGKLSEDGKTLLITAANTFDGEYAVTVSDAVKDSKGVALEKYSELVKASDKVAPKLVSASASAKTATDKFTLVFDEPVQATGAIVSVNGVSATVAAKPGSMNELVVTSSAMVNAGTTATIKIINVKDYANNFITPNPLETNVTVTADTVAPNIVSTKVIGENKVEVKFDKNMNISSFANKARLVAGSGTVTNLTATAGSDAKTVILTGSLNYTDTYSALLFLDADIKDTAGNNISAYSTSVIFKKDVIAPTLSSVEYKDGKIVAKFSENIAAGSNSTVTAINQTTGVATTITLDYTTLGSVNAVIKDDTLTITQGLADGTYQLRLLSNTVVDTAGSPNGNALTTQNFVVVNNVASDDVRPTVSSIANGSTPPAQGTAPGLEQTVTYTAADPESGVSLETVRDLNNYTWDGKALPAGSYVTTVLSGPASKATSVAVTVHIPSEKISATKTAPFTVNGIRDNAGNSILSVGTGNVTLADGLKPTFDSAVIASNEAGLILGFSEAIQHFDKDDVEILLNGKDISDVVTFTNSLTENNKYVATAQVTKVKGISGAADTIFVDVDGDGSYNATTDALIAQGTGIVTANGLETLKFTSANQLQVKLVAETSDEVTDLQGNQAVFNKTITVK
ncbi:Ig-like domain-containing protein [Exiguobacterium sp. s123]|uniref:Ig-like domain-containing protein n=1 Tax=Exiguobacterium sp. s123 TaxID=2751289 RepID=UPI001BEB8213|nr:Ig-like domain-containing protein [Exiguobacterium sp. s123]